MEATIQSTNRAINIDINVSINVDALKANIQRLLQAIKQSAWQAIKQCVLIAINVSINVDALKAIIQRGWQATWKAINVYVLQPVKQEVSKITLSDVVIFLMLLAFAFEIYMYA